METNPLLIGKKLDLIAETLKGVSAVLGSSLADKGAPALIINTPQSPYDQREQFRTQGTIVYPSATMVITGISRNRGDSYNDGLRRVGINAARDNNTYSNLSLTPITMTLSFKYTTQSAHEALHFSERWLRAEMDSQFYLQNENQKLLIKLVFSEDLTFPELTLAENGNFYYVETSLTVATYSGNIYTRTKLNKISVSAEVSNNSTSIIEDIQPAITGVKAL